MWLCTGESIGRCCDRIQNEHCLCCKHGVVLSRQDGCAPALGFIYRLIDRNGNLLNVNADPRNLDALESLESVVVTRKKFNFADIKTFRKVIPCSCHNKTRK